MAQQTRAPLLEALLEHLQQALAPFHTPGHKQGRGADPGLVEALQSGALGLDLTELPGLDNLHDPRGPIAAAQELAAECFGAAATFFLVNGASVGIMAALLALTGPGDKVLTPRNAHRSLLNGLILSGASPLFVQPEVHHDTGLVLGASAAKMAVLLDNDDAVRLILAIHPSYYGLIGDWPQLTQPAWRRGIPILADEAHGSHFYFHPDLPQPALAAGAGIAVHGSHKTLGSLTQSGMLHVTNRKLSGSLQAALGVLQTTSPSYLLMVSLDTARRQMATKGPALLGQTLSLAWQVREAVNRIPGLYCYGEELCRMPATTGFDPLKIIILVRGLGLSGYEAANILRSEAGIQVEMADPGHVLALITVGDNQETINRLIQGLQDLAASHRGQTTAWPIGALPPLPTAAVTPRQAYLAPSREINLVEAAGEVAAGMVVPYPPGIPVLYPGEIITWEIIEYILEIIHFGADIQGLGQNLQQPFLPVMAEGFTIG